MSRVVLRRQSLELVWALSRRCRGALLNCLTCRQMYVKCRVASHRKWDTPHPNPLTFAPPRS
eukprot:scaffold92265_cov32-Tisochrysis_lutea.AAC.2